MALLIIFAVFGIGFSMVNAPITNAAVSGMPLDRAGAASAVTSTSRQVGVSIGVALCGSVAGSALSATGSGFRRRGRDRCGSSASAWGGDHRRWASLDVAAGDSFRGPTCAADRRRRCTGVTARVA